MTSRRLTPTGVRDLLLVGLTFSSGAVDAISFIALGKVFTAFMTGNIVFLGLRAAGEPGPNVLTVVASLAGFAVGVFVSTRIIKAPKGSSVWPQGATLALGVAVIAQAAFVAGWMAASGHPTTGVTDLLVGLSALAMGIQSGAVLSLGVRGVFTTAVTATMIFLASDVARKSSASERARLAGVLIALFAGAAAGGLLLIHARTYAPVLPLVVTILVVAIAWNPLSARDGGGDDGGERQSDDQLNGWRAPKRPLRSVVTQEPTIAARHRRR
jgi:uncharacterized membrane protein YoaK (UPF0700 family)